MKNIAISGGGLNSIYFLGAIKYLDENFNGEFEFNTKEASIKIEKPDWIKN